MLTVGKMDAASAEFFLGSPEAHSMPIKIHGFDLSLLIAASPVAGHILKQLP
jgi:hypothetical protein